jgi:hypothetical protein
MAPPWLPTSPARKAPCCLAAAWLLRVAVSQVCTQVLHCTPHVPQTAAPAVRFPRSLIAAAQASAVVAALTKKGSSAQKGRSWTVGLVQAAAAPSKVRVRLSLGPLLLMLLLLPQLLLSNSHMTVSATAQ